MRKPLNLERVAAIHFEDRLDNHLNEKPRLENVCQCVLGLCCSCVFWNFRMRVCEFVPRSQVCAQQEVNRH